MKTTKRFQAFLILAVLVLTPSAQAREPFAKLGRGFTNIATSPAEIAVRMIEIGQDHDYLTAAFGGLFKGAAYMVGRIGSGVYDILTFPAPVPAQYGPLMKPETVFDSLKEFL